MSVIKSLLSDKSFWAALAALVACIFAAFHVAPDSAAQITAFISGIGTVIAYIINNGIQAAAQIKANAQIEVSDLPAEDKRHYIK
jgi:hypothetical protein